MTRIILAIEEIVLCIMFSVMVLIMAKEPIKTLYNYPPRIQERVKSLEMYKDKIPETEKVSYQRKLKVRSTSDAKRLDFGGVLTDKQEFDEEINCIFERRCSA